MSIKTSKVLIGILMSTGLVGTTHAQSVDDKFKPRIYGSLAVSPAIISEDAARISGTAPSQSVLVTPVARPTHAPLILASSTTGSYTSADVDLEARRVIAFQNANSAQSDYPPAVSETYTLEGAQYNIVPERRYAVELFEPAVPTYAATTQTFTAASSNAASAHYVVEGDTLYSLARRYNTDVPTLRSANNLTGNSIDVGQNLTIPSTGGHILASNVTSASSNTVSRPVSAVSESRLIRSVQPVPSQGVYAVLPKDTLWSIAERACVSVDGIRAQNGLGESDYIAPGQRLTMPLGHCLN